MNYDQLIRVWHQCHHLDTRHHDWNHWGSGQFDMCQSPKNWHCWEIDHHIQASTWGSVLADKNRWTFEMLTWVIHKAAGYQKETALDPEGYCWSHGFKVCKGHSLRHAWVRSMDTKRRLEEKIQWKGENGIKTRSPKKLEPFQIRDPFIGIFLN